MPDFLDEEVSGEHRLVVAQQHLVNASWKNTTLSLVAVVLALIALLAYWVIGVDAANRKIDELENTLKSDHKVLLCRDVVAYSEDRAIADTLVIFLRQLSNLASDVALEPEAMSESIRSLRAIQSNRDTAINSCLNSNTDTSQGDQISSHLDG